MKKNRLFLACMISAGIALSASAWAEEFPSHPVTIVVPYSAGGGTDTLARRMAKTLSEHWHVPVIVENIPGADGLIGTERVLRMPADGYTLLLQVSQIMMWKKTQPNSHVDIPRDFRLVSEIQTSPLAFGVSPSLPVNPWVSSCNGARPMPRQNARGGPRPITVDSSACSSWMKRA